MSDRLEWFRRETHGAPARLADRAAGYLSGVANDPVAPAGDGLAGAGQCALAAAIAGDDRRDAAIDLLAADTLITLALLEVAREHPEQLGQRARALRTGAATVTV